MKWDLYITEFYNNALALTFPLHLIRLKFAKRSGFFLFLLAQRMSVAVLNERSIDPDRAGTASEFLATAERNGKRQFFAL